MKRDLQLAALYLDLSRDKTFSEDERALFKKIAFARGARELEAVPEDEKRRRRRRRRA